MSDDLELLVSDPAPRVDLLQEEYRRAGILASGAYECADNQQTRRMIWPGQSADGRKWDQNQPDGQAVRPWNGCSDTRVPLADDVCNDQTAVLCSAFDRAELHATAIEPGQAEVAASLTDYLTWMVRTKHARELRPEVELAAQYSREQGWCAAYVGWERELARKNATVTLEGLREFIGQAGGPEAGAALVAAVLDPSQEAAAAAEVQSLYGAYTAAQLEASGFFADELQRDGVLKLSAGRARRAVRELREGKSAQVPLAYVSKNQPLVAVLEPYSEFLAARGTSDLQKAPALFWRRFLTDAELEAGKVDGWDADWIEAVKKTKGDLSAWATEPTGMSPGRKQVGATTWYQVDASELNPRYEVVYGFVRKVDEDGVSSIYQTIFSPHANRLDGGDNDGFCAKHERLDYAHSRYPFVGLKRENISRGLCESRSVPEVANTWQAEMKCQRDMLFNRAQWDTLPPVRVASLGGVGLRLGPGAQVPMKRADTIEAINLGAPPPSLALELVGLVQHQSDRYFGQFNPEVPPALIGVKQEKMVGDFYAFWGEVFMHMFALTLQFNPGLIARVTGDGRLPELDPLDVFDAVAFGMVFDVQELNPDYLTEKAKIVNEFLIPTDAAGVIDRSALTQQMVKMLGPQWARLLVKDQAGASQAMFREVDRQVGRMALGNEAEYTENDPTAGAKLRFLGQIVQSNPKYQRWLGSDERFAALLENYSKNLQQSLAQEENKTVGRLGVKPVGA